MANTISRRKRRTHLIEAAQRAMAEHGVGVRLNQVAEEAGITSGAILYRYPNLQELLIDANRAGMERFYNTRIKSIEGISDPAKSLVRVIRSGLPLDDQDLDVRLLCELGGAAARYTVYGALLTGLFDRQVAMYQVILESGSGQAAFKLTQPSLTIARNIVALEDAYGYRIMAGHPAIDYEVGTRLILDYARSTTGNPLEEH